MIAFSGGLTNGRIDFAHATLSINRCSLCLCASGGTVCSWKLKVLMVVFVVWRHSQGRKAHQDCLEGFLCVLEDLFRNYDEFWKAVLGEVSSFVYFYLPDIYFRCSDRLREWQCSLCSMQRWLNFQGYCIFLSSSEFFHEKQLFWL